MRQGISTPIKQHRRNLVMKNLLLALLMALLITTGGCSQEPEFSEAEVLSEARAFMEGYAEDIRIRDAEAVAARYDRLGA